jgi:hypothetical protein
VVLLRERLDLFGTAADGRLFRSENGNLIHPSAWWWVWHEVRCASLSTEDLASPLTGAAPMTCGTQGSPGA